MIVFLDFDGVTHGLEEDRAPFDEECLLALQTALMPLEADLVVTSTWRELYELEELRTFLGPLGERVIDRTPVIEDFAIPHHRFREIQLWLINNEREEEPWIAIDDMPHQFPADAPLVRTDRDVGFQHADIAKVWGLLTDAEA